MNSKLSSELSPVSSRPTSLPEPPASDNLMAVWAVYGEMDWRGSGERFEREERESLSSDSVTRGFKEAWKRCWSLLDILEDIMIKRRRK